MKITKGSGKSKYGTGVSIHLDSADVYKAIHAYLLSHGVYTSGASTFFLDENEKSARIYVDPSGKVIDNGEEVDGRTGEYLRYD